MRYERNDFEYSENASIRDTPSFFVCQTDDTGWGVYFFTGRYRQNKKQTYYKICVQVTGDKDKGKMTNDWNTQRYVGLVSIHNGIRYIFEK